MWSEAEGGQGGEREGGGMGFGTYAKMQSYKKSSEWLKWLKCPGCMGMQAAGL